MKKILLLLILVVVLAACSSSKGGNPTPTPTPTPTDPVEYDATGQIEGATVSEHVKVYYIDGLVDRIEVSVSGNSDITFTYRINYNESEAYEIRIRVNKLPHESISDRDTINRILKAAEDKAFIEFIKTDPIEEIEFLSEGLIEGVKVSEIVGVRYQAGLIVNIQAKIEAEDMMEFPNTYNFIYDEKELVKIELTSVVGDSLTIENSITDKKMMSRILSAAENEDFITPMNPLFYRAMAEGQEIENVAVFYDDGLIKLIYFKVLNPSEQYFYNIIYEGSEAISIEINNLQGKYIITDREEINRILLAAKNKEFIEPILG